MGIANPKTHNNSSYLPFNKLFVVWCKFKETLVMFTTIQCQTLPAFFDPTDGAQQNKKLIINKGNNFILV
jgi:hypothetical protein